MTDSFERGRFASATLIEGAVHRTAGPAASSVHRLLQHFERSGTSLTPRFLGWAENGKEVLSYLPGDTGYPPYSEEVRSNDALITLGRSIRQLHDISTRFDVRPDDRWHGMESTSPTQSECIGHGDLTPWNVVFRGEEVVGIIDWDTARPMSRVWDLAYAAYHFVPLHPLRDLSDWGWEKQPDISARLGMLLEAYGMNISREELISTAVIRLLSMAQYIDTQIAAENPFFAVHAEEKHSVGYRAAALDLLSRQNSGVFRAGE